MGSGTVITLFAIICLAESVINLNNATDNSCTDVRRHFTTKGIGTSQLVPDTRTNGDDLTICTSSQTCCSKAMEGKYEDQVKKDFKLMLQSSGSYLKTLITTSATKFKDTFLDMVQVSENSTTALFSDVYQLIESTARVPLSQLYADLLAYMTGQDVDLEDRVNAFFDALFPLAFDHSVNSKNREFPNSYKQCLKIVQHEVRPFGDLPNTVVLHIKRSFEAARTFLEALQVGVEVLNTTEHLDFGAECRTSLVKLSYCSHCQGIFQHHSRPCSSLCTNVMRGCLASVSELDTTWSEFVGALERLTSGMVGTYNIEQVLQTLDIKISETIVFVMENTHEITRRVKFRCGNIRRVAREVSLPPPPLSSTSEFPARSTSTTVENFSGTSLYIQIQNFVQKVAESKSFYGNLADNLCKDVVQTAKSDQRCWNGHAIGDYSKTVAGVGISAQKHNPEVKSQKAKDIVITTLIEKLQHIRQVMTSQVTSVPQSDSSVVVDGSGSGSLWHSRSDDEDYADGSGSGDGSYGKEEKTDLHFERTEGGSGTIHTSGVSRLDSFNNGWLLGTLAIFVMVSQFTSQRISVKH